MKWLIRKTGTGPVIDLIGLPVRKLVYRTLNPMCPPQQLLDHLIPITDASRRRAIASKGQQ